MRHELIHFLSHVEDEQLMIGVIANLNVDSYASLLHHLAFTSSSTQERWQKLMNQVLR
ncbi:hypothetical protein DFQ01_108159 [Paenibacillus cellulosilyticus]|uniref:Uncharacterized protein n=1 Tax=Paenibacillus cellulosilyticus TaxID=375489 RepID=A0A2V2YV29_9BACL|nr:hypothetical protein [Paenibacillus cellulosilyticus]PWW02882.1 hypothetical protein DFQ01_108159 [Paenibacillus cellulosilyticus]QKS45795.1 hypothetical protein HUB94_16120 [Paenibacillus cellulosilyticus]